MSGEPTVADMAEGLGRLTAALAAEKEKVARLREALEAVALLGPEKKDAQSASLRLYRAVMATARQALAETADTAEAAE